MPIEPHQRAAAGRRVTLLSRAIAVVAIGVTGAIAFFLGRSAPATAGDSSATAPRTASEGDSPGTAPGGVISSDGDVDRPIRVPNRPIDIPISPPVRPVSSGNGGSNAVSSAS